MPDKKPLIFISYSHQDPEWLDYVTSHLAPGVSHDQFETWDDRQIGTGKEWEQEIESALGRCRVFIILVSRFSLSSNFILRSEVKTMLEKHRARGVRIFPILVSGCDIAVAPWLTKMNIKPLNLKALDSIPDIGKRNAVMAEIAKEIRLIVSETHSSNLGAEEAGSSQKDVFDIPEATNPVPRCAELRAGTTQGSTRENFDLLPELRFGWEPVLVDLKWRFEFAVTMAELRVHLKECEIAPGPRLGDTDHSNIRAEGRETWIISPPTDVNVLSRLVLGTEILCKINGKKGSKPSVTLEVWCPQHCIEHRVGSGVKARLPISKLRILGAFINRCIGTREGHVILCSATMSGKDH